MIRVLIVIIAVVAAVALIFRWRLKSAGLNVTSWYRTPWKNASVGGSRFSQHMIAWAFDVTPSNSAVMKKLQDMGFRTVLSEKDHIHASVL